MLKNPRPKMARYTEDLPKYQPFVDYTLLKADANFGELRELCVFARENADAVRAICIHPDPRKIQFCRDVLSDSGIKICAVNDFPLGQGGARSKVSQALDSRLAGADEVDTVINVGFLKEGLYEKILEELCRLPYVLPTKVIIETGYPWYTEDLIKKAAQLVAEAGAFCVKTSTGFIANIPVEDKVRHVKWMHEAAPNLMIKVAGGIKTMAHAQLFWDVVQREKLIFGASAAFWKA